MKMTGDSAPQGGLVLVTVLRGVQGDVRDGVKANTITAVMRFCGMAGGWPVAENTHTLQMILPVGGDAGWVKRNVTSRADPTGVEAGGIDRMVGRMMDRFEENGGTPDVIGLAVLTGWLEGMYMRYDLTPLEKLGGGE